MGKVARDRERRSGRPSGEKSVDAANAANPENGGGGGGAGGAGNAAPRKSIRPRPVDMHKPLPVLRADLVSAMLESRGGDTGKVRGRFGDI